MRVVVLSTADRVGSEKFDSKRATGKARFMHPYRAVTKPVAVIPFLLTLVVGCAPSRQEGGSSSTPNSRGTGAAPAEVGDGVSAGLEILSPFDEALFPPDIVAPSFRWKDGNPDVDSWRIVFEFSDGGPVLDFVSCRTEWNVPDEVWEDVKVRCRGQEARVTISSVRGAGSEETANSRASVRIGVSEDAVEAPLFFREVNLPFATAVKDPAACIRWRFGPISSKEPPPIVLEKLPVCGNCHSFSADGSVMGMDVDYANDRASYAILSPMAQNMVLDKDRIIAWSNYRKEDDEQTFGLLSQVSPCGRYVMSTVKDYSVFVATEGLAFSQLFFPIKGILVYYDRETREFHSLPGADDPQFVQSNPVWSPDGKYVVFARSEAYELKNVAKRESALLTREECKVFLEGGKKFRFDLYRIPFNEGRGGKAEPVEGASENGMSNYFAKFSPDGKWLVFCRAESFMLLQPDSELYIVPAEGGEARRLRCNTSRMNSWHSWSPNGKWLAFSSKAHSVYTQLFLTHIDEEGRSSVPVVLSRFTEPERAVNIPEFVNLESDAIRKIAVRFLDDHSYFRATFEYIKDGEPAQAIPLLRKSLDINPNNASSRVVLGIVLAQQGEAEEAKAHFLKVLELPSTDVETEDLVESHHRLAFLFDKEGKFDEAVAHCREAVKLAPALCEPRIMLGMMLMRIGKLDEAEEHFVEAVRLEADNTDANYYCGHVLSRQGRAEEAIPYYERALELDSKLVPALLELAAIRMMFDRPELFDVDKAIALAETACEVAQRRDVVALQTLAGAYAFSRRYDDAVRTAREALQLALASGNRQLADATRKNLEVYEKLQAEDRK